MKLSIITLGLPLAAHAHVVKRQFGGGGGLEGLLTGAASAFLKTEKAAKTVEGVSRFKREGVKNVNVYHGPVKLLPAAEAAKVSGALKTDKSSNTFNWALQGFPVDSYILRTNSTLVFEDGTPATANDGVYNHHIQLFDIGKSPPQPFQCGALNEKAGKGFSMGMGYFGGNAADGAPSLFTTPDGTFNSGHLLPKQSTVFLNAELINYASTPKSVYFVTEIDYIPGKPEGIMNTNVGIMSVNQCDLIPNPFLRPPQGKKVFELKSKNLTITQDGYLLSRRGHMHDGGTGMTIKINDKLICDSKAIYNKVRSMEDGTESDALSGMVECNEPFQVKRGDTLSVEAFFDLNKHPARKHAHGGGEAEGMALMGFVFASKNDPK